MNKSHLLAFVLASLTPALTVVGQSELREFRFEIIETKVLPGNSTDPGDDYGCGVGILDEDIIGNLAVASELYQNGCYTDGNYNHRNYKVEKGRVSSSDGEVTLEAYRVSEPAQKAKEFLGSEHRLQIRFEAQNDYSIYAFEGGAFTKLLEVAPADTKVDEFIKISEISASAISGSQIFAVAPTSQRVSVFEEVSQGVEAATVFQKDGITVDKTRYTIDGNIYDTSTGFDFGPATHDNIYGQGRNFFPFSLPDDKIGVAWQDQSNDAIYLTTINTSAKTKTNSSLPTSPGKLASVARDQDTGRIFYLTITEGNSPMVTLNSATSEGKKILSKTLDTSKKSGLNIWVFDGDETATLVFNENKLGLIISRTMNKSSDGLNHQGAIAVMLDPETLSVTRNFGQTSGHSFDNILYADPNGGFYGFDMGDNYPRGINVHRIVDDNIRSKLVYTFKTAHGTSQKSPARASYPLYKEISSGATKFYQWSNDNKTYSELGGMVPFNGAFGIFFIGEPNTKGRAIDNSRAKGYLSDARNIGFVKIKDDFVGQDFVLSKGVSEPGGFYTFGGKWSQQKNEGIIWLTKYSDLNSANASRLKTALLPAGTVLLFWELWTPESYVSTYFMEVDQTGNIISGPTEIGSHLRLNRRDEPLLHNGSVYFISGVKTENVLEVIEVRQD